MSADKDSANFENEGDNAELDLSRLVSHKSGDPEADTAADAQQRTWIGLLSEPHAL